MGMGTLTRAAEWFRRALQTGESAMPAESRPAKAETRAYDPQLFEVLSEDLRERTVALRAAVRAIDSDLSLRTGEVYKNCVAEIEKIEDLVDGLSALATPPPGSGEPQSLELTDVIRRALSRHETRFGARLPVRVRGVSGTPRVMGRQSALVRSLALCFDATELVASPGSTLIVDVAPDDKFVIMNFRPTVVVSLLPGRVRDRMHSMLGLAANLAETCGAHLDVVARDSVMTPMLKIAVTNSGGAPDVC